MLCRLASAVLLASASSSSATAQSASNALLTDSLERCVQMKTSGADRLLTARWLFAVMAQSGHIRDLASVPAEQKTIIDKDFARLVTRLVVSDCLEEVKPLAAKDFEGAFEKVGEALGQTAMGELMGTKEVDEAIEAYTQFLSEADFKPLMDNISVNQSK